MAMWKYETKTDTTQPNIYLKHDLTETTKKRVVLCACKLLQYRQYLNKYSRDISRWWLKIIRGIWEMFIV